MAPLLDSILLWSFMPSQRCHLRLGPRRMCKRVHASRMCQGEDAAIRCSASGPTGHLSKPGLALVPSSSRSFKFSLEKIDQVSYELGYRVTLTRFRVKYPQLTIKEDPYATLPEDDNVLIEAEVPFDDSNPPTS
ncbi:hypothetical protein BHM03_00003016 [Ensete ventricosum]|nr:hypothetical protein BHM03_00003016 [Ensete ventricosum]